MIRPAGSVVGRVGADVARLLADPVLRGVAARWAERFAEVDGPAVAADPA